MLKENGITVNSVGERINFDTSFAFSEEMPLSRVSMIHEGCGEEVKLCLISDSHNALFCSAHGRLPDPVGIPIEINTVAKLRQWRA